MITAAILFGALYGIKKINSKTLTAEEEQTRANRAKKARGKGNVDKEFWERVFKLVRHVVPGWKSREAKYIISLAVLLVIRTMMSIWLADVNGRVVKAIVDKDLSMFIKRVSVHSLTLIHASVWAHRS